MTVRPPIRCSELVEQVTDWMEGALAHEHRQHLEEHLAVCPDCHEYVEQFRTSVTMLRDAPGGAPPPAARVALLAAFREGTPATD